MFTFSSTTFASINENFQKSTTEFTNNLNYSLITENNLISSNVSRTGAALAKFSGVYYGWLDVPFTVTNSSQTVKVLFSAKALNGSDITTY